jgi:hypothetical protein
MKYSLQKAEVEEDKAKPHKALEFSAGT